MKMQYSKNSKLLGYQKGKQVHEYHKSEANRPINSDKKVFWSLGMIWTPRPLPYQDKFWGYVDRTQFA
jgi:hypothetical protein